MAHFEIKNLSFTYPNTDKSALSDINLAIEKGQYVTVCGESGSGKTTLLKQLKSAMTPVGKREGTILFDGQELEVADLHTQVSKIGYVMQNPDDQIVTDKVWHELAFGLESLGVDQKTIRLRVAEMASYFGIQDWFHKDVSELSGGQKQLLNLASIMAMQPSVLILDEPTSQLDPIAASDFLNTVRKINRELRTTIVITEHRLEDILYASDKVVVMEKGSILLEGTPEIIGNFLRDQEHPMFAAMPTPMQVYYGVGQGGKSPLTVREGAEWLDTVLAKDGPHIASVSEKIESIEKPEKPALKVKEVWFRYEKEAPDVLKGVHLQVPKETIYAIVGGNGTGKSTLLKVLCGVCRQYRGNIKLEGKVSMLPQDMQCLFVKQEVQAELEEMTASKEDVKRVTEVCEIGQLLDRHPYDLSGGEQQRVALAKVLLTKPDILLLDEPTKGMDNFFKIKFAEILRKLKADGTTIIMVSHDIEFCAKYADVVGMFFDGNLITANTPHRFFSQNNFYTTAANRMSRHIFENAITNEDVIELCKKNGTTK